MASLEFDKLPLIQVDIKLAFEEPVLPFTPTVLLFLKDALTGRFPNVIDLKVIESAPGFGHKVPVGPNMLRGVAFGSKPKGVVTIIQNEVLVCRWLKLPGGVPYPRFDAMLETVSWLVAALNECLENALAINTVQMSYSNFIEAIDEGSADLTYLLSDDLAGPIRSRGPALQEYQLAWRDLSGTDIRVSIQGATQPQGTHSASGFLLRTIAGEILDRKSWEEGVRCSHEALIEHFPNLLSAQAKKEWGLKHGS